MHCLARIVVLALAAALLATAGCRLLDAQPKGKSPLTPLQAGEESVALEIFFARFDYGYQPFADPLWEQIDEQALPADIRRELARNGFRAGIVGSQVPVELARLLTLSDVAQPKQQGTTVNLEKEPSVKMRLLEIRSGRTGEIIASPVYDHLPLLWRNGEKIEGKTYDKADGRFVLTATRHVDGRVGLDLLPELHYGKTEQKWVPVDGVFRLVSSQRKKSFDSTKLRIDLAPGQMLVLTCRPDHPGSVGNYFFTEPVGGEGLAQRMVIVRLAQAGSDRSFSEIVSAEIDPATGQPTHGQAAGSRAFVEPLPINAPPGELSGER
ncbi:MAG TPA: hypothetical protein VHY91_27330 [Pirellulales bacterium]|jgi:hypothetical protein|nr:hypothetical protein [Pirellulales bacterium]